MQNATAPATAETAKAEIIFEKSVALNGVTAMVSSDDKKIVARAGKHNITISGENLSVEMLDVENSVAKIGGGVREIKYSAAPDVKSFLGKIFK